MNLSIPLVIAAIVTFAPGTVVLSAKHQPPPTPQSFLMKAAEGQQVEIALGQLAAEKASNEQVKQFGAQMIEDHQKASLEVERLASKEGVQLPTQLSGKHKDKKDKFSQLSGKEFDKAYMTYMLRDHKKDVKEFEQGVKAIKDPQVQQWAEGTLPVLKQHLQKAQQIASSIGISIRSRSGSDAPEGAKGGLR